jgi:hypothetical protein
MRITREQPGPRQLQEHVQRAWQEKQQQQDETSGTSNVSEGQCPQQSQGYKRHTAQQQDASADGNPAGSTQDDGQHNEQQHTAGDTGDLEIPGSCQNPGDGTPSAILTPRRHLPPLPGSVTWGRLTGEQAEVPCPGSLPGSLSSSGAGGTAAAGEDEQECVTARVIISRRTTGTKSAHWGSQEALGRPQASNKVAAQPSGRTILKRGSEPQQQQQQQKQLAALVSDWSLQERTRWLWHPVVKGWEWLRGMCVGIIKVRMSLQAGHLMRSLSAIVR